MLSNWDVVQSRIILAMVAERDLCTACASNSDYIDNEPVPTKFSDNGQALRQSTMVTAMIKALHILGLRAKPCPRWLRKG